MSVDYAAQAAATEALWAEMTRDHALPDEALVDLRLVGEAGADAVELMGWLEDRGYDVEHYPADEDEGEPEVVEVQTPRMRLSLAAVQFEERRVTEAALAHGFRPDGWGFMGA